MDHKQICQSLFDEYVAAYRRGDAAGCAAMFSADARLLSPYAPQAQGRDAITALHRDWVADGAEAKTINVLDAGGSGNTAWCFATFSEGTEDGDGTSLNILHREANGSWRISHCSLNEAFPTGD